MERATVNYYLIESNNYDTINRIWDYCQYGKKEIPMYKTRIAPGTTGWVVELPEDKTKTLFLLNFSSLVTVINSPYY